MTFEINISPFNCKVLVHTNKTALEGLSYLARKYKCASDMTDMEYSQAFVARDPTKEGVRWFMVLQENFEDKHLVHECVHLIQDIARYAGLELDKSSEEYYAYQIEDVYAVIKQKINKNTKHDKAN